MAGERQGGRGERTPVLDALRRLAQHGDLNSATVLKGRLELQARKYRSWARRHGLSPEELASHVLLVLADKAELGELHVRGTTEGEAINFLRTTLRRELADLDRRRDLEQRGDVQHKARQAHHPSDYLGDRHRLTGRLAPEIIDELIFGLGEALERRVRSMRRDAAGNRRRAYRLMVDIYHGDRTAAEVAGEYASEAARDTQFTRARAAIRVGILELQKDREIRPRMAHALLKALDLLLYTHLFDPAADPPEEN